MSTNARILPRLLLPLILLVPSGNALAAQFRFNDLPHFSGVSVRTDWCGEEVALKITALEDASIFVPPDGEYLQTMVVGKSRAVMGMICPRVKKITISGWYKGELHYAGSASEKNNWGLVGIYSAP
ncbi:MAG: hypothetical protein KJ558_09490 [Gammaproteobacteria bacterium]|nr:hypothetical protein [Gammaproteobacteria bacterium]MBU1655039.1 hypothetical protein [Gammaproteobacteria bacterium]MBU1961536.1 hypothetical protein [Gammaproteobacteria bacterium]